MQHRRPRPPNADGRASDRPHHRRRRTDHDNASRLYLPKLRRQGHRSPARRRHHGWRCEDPPTMHGAAEAALRAADWHRGRDRAEASARGSRSSHLRRHRTTGCVRLWGQDDHAGAGGQAHSRPDGCGADAAAHGLRTCAQLRQGRLHHGATPRRPRCEGGRPRAAHPATGALRRRARGIAGGDLCDLRRNQRAPLEHGPSAPQSRGFRQHVPRQRQERGCLLLDWIRSIFRLLLLLLLLRLVVAVHLLKPYAQPR
mmetsp:Transcript_26796/g.77232  ORF Transcript_26796/g.77232 Transcript_26796/m.77232 type:complete len:256 (+) Transcript_26796:370-1137(+)